MRPESDAAFHSVHRGLRREIPSVIRWRFVPMTRRLLASCNHRDSAASLPVKRASIFCSKAKEKGFVKESLPSRRADQLTQASDNYPDAGAGMIGHPCARNGP
jgi:hypothetical protein